MATNGQLGTLIAVIKTGDGSVAKFIIEFKNENVGHKNRQNNPKLAAKYPNGTIIEKVSFTYKKIYPLSWNQCLFSLK